MTMPKINLDQYFQYHNRLASFIDWKIDWEINGDKPSPEDLARAGFFSSTASDYNPDNVICPYCKIALDNWEPNDDPKREHQLRSGNCDFVLGRQKVRDMGKDAGAVNKQNGTSDANRPTQDRQERMAGSPEATILAQAGSRGNGAGPARRRRTGRQRKQTGGR
ncbi:hypothetical protein KVR01_006421 [Diaporthe batatas]|uniref:uncharacterized protein n=1 Tax=Diaporthe batatas TaxID=748121 RepID=UPI001D05B1F4|nr:uncharacterized protein KVR01_006421 [Diaporthe batatas]KAG8164503.1 hypothetical protein KVR01_006421 [Diaporthe batatas]